MMPGVVRGIILIPIGHLSQHHIPNAYIYPIGIRVVCHYCVDEGKGGHEGSGMFGGIGVV